MKKIRKIKKNVIIPNPCHTGHSIRIALSLVVLLYLSLSPLRAQSDCTVERGIKTGPPTLVEAIPIPPSEPDTTTDTESNPPFEGDRLIFWIHGLGGSSDSWTRTANHTHENYRVRSEEHTSELQSRPHISYAGFCLKQKKKKNNPTICF